MSKGFKSLRALLAAVFIFSYIVIAIFMHDEVDNYAVKQAESQLKNFLLSYKSVRRLIREWHKPEVYRLQDEGILDKDYFSPYLLSTSFNAHGFADFLNQELVGTSFPQLKFKLASDNPRNSINSANKNELETLEKMRAGEINSKKTVWIDENQQDMLTLSLPTTPVEARCLKCHGKPEDAPKELIELYGNKAGFYENIGKMRAIVSLTVPLKTYYDSAHHLLFVLLAMSALILFLLYWGIYYFVKKLQDSKKIITQQREELLMLSRTDKLTGTLNRQGFSDTSLELINLAERYTEQLSLILFDIDHFKKINDIHGHLAGDAALVNLVEITRKTIRNTDILCRWGGEEFVLLSPKTSLEDATILAERLRLGIEQCDNQSSEGYFRFTVSFGVVSHIPGCTIKQMIEAADTALYRAKELGRNRVEIGRLKDNDDKN